MARFSLSPPSTNRTPLWGLRILALGLIASIAAVPVAAPTRQPIAALDHRGPPRTTIHPLAHLNLVRAGDLLAPVSTMAVINAQSPTSLAAATTTATTSDSKSGGPALGILIPGLFAACATALLVYYLVWGEGRGWVAKRKRLREARLREALGLPPESNELGGVVLGETTDAAAARRLRRDPLRRTESGATLRTLPRYTKEAGDEELVLLRRQSAHSAASHGPRSVRDSRRGSDASTNSTNQPPQALAPVPEDGSLRSIDGDEGGDLGHRANLCRAESWGSAPPYMSEHGHRESYAAIPPPGSPSTAFPVVSPLTGSHPSTPATSAYATAPTTPVPSRTASRTGSRINTPAPSELGALVVAAASTEQVPQTPSPTRLVLSTPSPRPAINIVTEASPVPTPPAAAVGSALPHDTPTTPSDTSTGAGKKPPLSGMLGKAAKWRPTLPAMPGAVARSAHTFTRVGSRDVDAEMRASVGPSDTL